jgi:hypothetical protein
MRINYHVLICFKVSKTGTKLAPCHSETESEHQTTHGAAWASFGRRGRKRCKRAMHKAAVTGVSVNWKSQSIITAAFPSVLHLHGWSVQRCRFDATTTHTVHRYGLIIPRSNGTVVIYGTPVNCTDSATVFSAAKRLNEPRDASGQSQSQNSGFAFSFYPHPSTSSHVQLSNVLPADDDHTQRVAWGRM